MGLHALPALVLILTLVILPGCRAGGNEYNNSYAQSASQPSVYQIGPDSAGAQLALVGSSETLAGEFSTEAYSVLSHYGGEQGLSYGAYQTGGVSQESLLATLELADKGGAVLVVLLGEDISPYAAAAQAAYPEVEFVLMAMTGAGTEPARNGILVRYAAEEGGWLAGYAAVLEGYTELAVYEEDNELSTRLGLGFLLGAEAAAKELYQNDDLTASSAGENAAQPEPPIWVHVISVEEPAQAAGSGQDANNSEASGSAAAGSASPQRLAADAAYEAGAQLIFANRIGSGQDVRRAAQVANGRMIAITTLTGTAPSGDSVLLTMQLSPTQILNDLLTGWSADRFAGGTEAGGTVGNGSIGLDLSAGNAKTLTDVAYDGLVDSFRYGGLADKVSKAVTNEAGDLVTLRDLSLTQVALLPPGDGAAPAPVPEEGGGNG